jgi:hypothetical protein
MDTRQYAECGGCGRLYNTSKDNEIVEMDTHDCNATCKDCGHNKVECPSHEGNFDCNSFCALCEGDQEYCPTCDPTALCVDCRTPLVGDKWYYSFEDNMGSRVCPKCYGDADGDSLAVRTE